MNSPKNPTTIKRRPKGQKRQKSKQAILDALATAIDSMVGDGIVLAKVQVVAGGLCYAEVKFEETTVVNL